MKRLTPDLHVVNHRFEISPQAADKMWSEGRPVPINRHGYNLPDRLDPYHALRSFDGRWLIRRLRPSSLTRDAGFNTEEIAEQGAVEFRQLQEQGIDVISHGITPSVDGQMIFTVSPWLADLAPCPPSLFQREIPPRLGQYYKNALGKLVLAVSELNRSGQYSVLPAIPDRPVLHDVDPYVLPVRSVMNYGF